MCLLIFKPAGVAMPQASLEHGYAENPHGMGVAWAQDGQLRCWRSLDKFRTLCEKVAGLTDYPALIHFRWATHGAKTRENCHPFLASDKSFVMAHNGVLPIHSTPEVSDTRHFLTHVLENLKPGWHKNWITCDWLEEALYGNKVGVLFPNGEWVLLNEKDGDWAGEVWYSNQDYLPPVVQVKERTPRRAQPRVMTFSQHTGSPQQNLRLAAEEEPEVLGYWVEDMESSAVCCKNCTEEVDPSHYEILKLTEYTIMQCFGKRPEEVDCESCGEALAQPMLPSERR